MLLGDDNTIHIPRSFITGYNCHVYVQCRSYHETHRGSCLVKNFKGIGEFIFLATGLTFILKQGRLTTRSWVPFVISPDTPLIIILPNYSSQNYFTWPFCAKLCGFARRTYSREIVTSWWALAIQFWYALIAVIFNHQRQHLVILNNCPKAQESYLFSGGMWWTSWCLIYIIK